MVVTRTAALWLTGGAVLVSGLTTTVALHMTGSNDARPTAQSNTLGGGTITATAPGNSSSNNGNSGQSNSGNGGGNGAGSGSPGKAIAVSGTATGTLGPGHDDVLTVTIVNPNNSPINVTKVTGTITSVKESSKAVGPVACSATWFHLLDYTVSTRVEAGKSNTVPMTVHFDDTSANQDRCKGASYAFSLTATANQAS